MLRCLLTTTVVLLVMAPVAAARPGDLDRSFANGGRLATTVWGTGGSTAGLALLDGRRPLLSVWAARDGRAAPTWLRLTAGGRVAASTQLATATGEPPQIRSGFSLRRLAGARFELARLDPPATPVTVTLPFETGVGLVGVDRAGRIIVVGWQASTARYVAARFLADGRPDASYGTEGVGDLGQSLSDVLVRPDGRVYALIHRGLISLDPSGRRDPGVVLPAFPKAAGIRAVTELAEGPGSTLLLAAHSRRGAVLARLLATGRRDNRFGHRGVSTEPLARTRLADLTRDGRGRIVVGGYWSRTDNSDLAHWSAAVARFSARGRLDRSFASGGHRRFTLGLVRGVDIVASDIEHVAIDDRGRIVVAGQSYDDEFQLREDLGQPYPAIARLKG